MSQTCKTHLQITISSWMGSRRKLMEFQNLLLTQRRFTRVSPDWARSQNNSTAATNAPC